MLEPIKIEEPFIFSNSAVNWEHFETEYNYSIVMIKAWQFKVRNNTLVKGKKVVGSHQKVIICLKTL